MKARRIMFFPLALLLISFSGCRSTCDAGDRAEGFHGEKLGVYVRIGRSEIPATYKNDTHNYMIALGENRAAQLLRSYIMISSGGGEAAPLLDKIPGIVKSYRIVCEECNDDYCGAFIDYDAGALKEIIGK